MRFDLRFAVLAFCCLPLLASSVASASGPLGSAVQGTLYSPSGTVVTSLDVDFTVQVYDKSKTCVLYEEIHSGVDLSTTRGAFSLELGKGDVRANKIDNSAELSLNVFRNNATPVSVTGCNSPLVFADGDERYVRLTFTVDASGTLPVGPITLEPDLKIGSTPYSSVAATLNGKADVDFVQIKNDANAVLTQQNLEFAFSSTNYPRLQSLLIGGQTLSNIGAPSAPTDAVNKSYADSNIGGKLIDLSAIGPAIGNGKVLTWDAAAGKWVASQPSSGITSLTGDITASGAGSVVASITADAVTNTKIANGAITSSKIDSGYAINRLVITDGTTGSNLTYSVCPNVNEVLKWTTNGWQCANLTTFAPVTSVAGKTGNVSLNINDVDGLGTAAVRSVGTANGNVIEVTATGLPALDGAQLTNVNATRLQSRTMASVPPTLGQVLMWNGSQWEPSTPASASGTSTGVFLADNGTVNAPSISFSSETGTGFYKRVNGQVAFTANGSDGFLFTNGAISSPIPGGVQIMTSGGTPSNPAYRFVGENTTGMYSPSTGSIAFSTVSTERLRISATGNVGIGTTVPTARLHLAGGGAGPNGAALKITEGNLLTNPEAGAIEFDGTSLYFTDAATNRHMLWAGVDTSKSGDYYSGITYTTSDGGTPYGTCLNPTETLMNSGQMTDIGSWGSTGDTNSWIQADLGSSKPVVGIVVGGAGPLTCWGDSPTSYWNSAGSNIKIQTSLDGSSWTEVANGSAISYTQSPQSLTFTTTTARYVRIFLANGWLATGSFRILSKAPVASGQWASSGSSLLYNGNAVAIGTASPSGTLTVGGAGFGAVNNFPSLLTLAATSGDPWALSFTRTDLGPNSSVSFLNRGDVTSGRFSLAVGDGNGASVTPLEIDKTKSVFRGNVGIGTNSPGASLDVNGAIKSLQSINIYVDTNRADDTGDGFTIGTAKKTLGAAINLADSLTTSRVTILIANSSSGNRARMGSTSALTNKTIQISANQQATCYIDWDAGLRVDNVSFRLGLLGWETGCNILVNTPYMFVTDSGFFHLVLNQGGNLIRFNGDNQSLFYERYLNHVAGNIRIIGDAFNPSASTITGSGVNGSKIISDIFSGQNVYVEGNVASNFIDSSVNASGVYYEKNISSLASGKVGIGTTSPTEKLEVTGTVKATAFSGDGSALTNIVASDSNRVAKAGDTMTGALNLPAGSAASPSLNLTTAGLYSPGASSIGFTSAGTERMRITASGYVGIGTATPNAKLEVASGSAGVSGLKFTNFNSSTATSTGQPVGVDASGNLVTVAAPGTIFPLTGSLGSASAPTYSFTGDSDTGWYSSTAGVMAASTNGIDRFIIDSNGNIGINSASPNVRLDVNGITNVKRIDSNQTDSAIYTGSSASANPDGALNYFTNTSTATGTASHINWQSGTNQRAYMGIVRSPSGNTPAIVIGQQTAASQTTERMRIDANGNIGIGTTSPSSKLEIASSGAAGTYSAMNSGIMIKNSGGTEMLRIYASDPNAANFNSANLYIGASAGASNPSDNTSAGYYNTGVGYQTLMSITTGAANTALGIFALDSNTTGGENVAIGKEALTANISGAGSTGVGYQALASSTGNNNSGFGRYAGWDITSGTNNTLVGMNTGRGVTTGSNNTIIGAGVTGLAAGLSNNIIIADGAGNRRINVDSSGNVGIGTTTPANALDIGTGGGIRIASGTPGSTSNALYNSAGTLMWNGSAVSTSGGGGSAGSWLIKSADYTMSAGDMVYLASGDTADAFYNSNVLALHFDGANGSTTFTDQTGKTVTPVGGAMTISTAQSKFGGASGVFSNGNYLNLGYNSAFSMNGQDFTVETWVHPTAYPGGNGAVILDNGSWWGSNQTNYEFGMNSTGQIWFAVGQSNSSTVNAGVGSQTSVALNTWAHLAAVKQGSLVTLYINGVSQASMYLTFTPNNASGSNRPLYIGTLPGNTGGYYFTGYIDDLRITSGVARYLSNFVPPVAAFSNSAAVVPNLSLPASPATGASVRIRTGNSLATVLGNGSTISGASSFSLGAGLDIIFIYDGTVWRF